MSQIIPTAEPFFFPGKTGKPGCLLTHGFTGAPKEMRWMGEYLNREYGCTCLGIRLAGHATRPEDMIRSRYTDWMASVEDGYHLLNGTTQKIFLLGLSMGGILSLLMSTKLDVAGVVAMSTPYKLPDDPRLRYIKLIAFLKPFMPKNKKDAPPDTGWFDKGSFDQHVSYPQNPVRSIAELVTLQAEMRAALPKVKVPVLLVHSRNDDYVIKDSMQRIYDDLGTSDKTMLWVEGSGHVVTEEPQRGVVFKAAADFIRRVTHA
jgi:carboxylesterase